MGAELKLASESTMAEPRLTYLDIESLAEPTRLSFAIGGIAFEDVRWSPQTVAEEREALPFGQVPPLTSGGKVYAQSGALLRWAGRQARLYPTDLSLPVDMVLGALHDIRSTLRPLWYGHAVHIAGRMLVPFTQDQQAAVMK